MTSLRPSANSTAAIYNFSAPPRLAGWGSAVPAKAISTNFPITAATAPNNAAPSSANPLAQLWHSVKLRFTAFRLQMQMQKKFFLADDGGRVRIFKSITAESVEKPLMVIVCGFTDAFGLKRDVWTAQVKQAKKAGHPVMLVQLPMARRKTASAFSPEKVAALTNEVIRTNVHTAISITFPNANPTTEALSTHLAATRKRAGYRVVPPAVEVTGEVGF